MKIDPDVLLAIPPYQSITISQLTKKSKKSNDKVRKDIKDYKKRGWITTNNEGITKINITNKGLKAQEIIQ